MFRWVSLRIAGVVLAAGAVVAVSGCAAGSDAASAVADGDRPAWCGEGEITLALADAFGGNSWKQISAAEAEDEAGKCPAVTEFIYQDAQGDTQKSISDIRSLTAQGVDALLVFPEGEVQLPAIREAFQAGVAVVPYRVEVGGKDGVDYTQYLPLDSQGVGEIWGEWIGEALNGEGKVAYLGGPAANTQSGDRAAGFRDTLAAYPGIEIVGDAPYVVTNWDPAETQRVMSALLAQHPDIAAIAVDTASASIVAAYQQAGIELPLIASQDENGFSCEFDTLKTANPGFEIQTVESQTWHSRMAVQFAVAAATGGTAPEVVTIPNLVFEDSLSGQPNKVVCNADLPATASNASQLTPEQIAEALR